MSRDYKSPARHSKAGNNHPMLTGFIIGLFAGLGVSLAVALWIYSSPSPFAKRAEQADAGLSKHTPTAPATTQDNENEDKQHFDFYTILPGTEELVTENELKQAPLPPQDSYFLQIGAFRNSPEADNVKARLALLGIETTIQNADIPGKGVWYRVRVGPYDNADELDRMRATLTQNGIPATPLKVHKP